jgi:HPt (histidine-containing phosphotransfer) domain-containing protein
MSTSPIDKAKVIAMVGGNEDVANEMLTLFGKDLEEHIGKLRQLTCQSETMPDFQRLLHRILGSTAYFAANDLNEVVRSAEQLAKRSDHQALEALLPEIYREAERVLNCELIQMKS